MDVLKTIIIVSIALGIAKKLTKGLIKVVIILGVIVYITTKVLT